MSEFVDTNIFIRLLTRDDPRKMHACQPLFQRASRGDVSLFTSETVVAEVVYVLSSPALYQLSRGDIPRRFRPVLRVRGPRIEHKRAILRALNLYEQTNLDFEDRLPVEHVRRAKLDGIYSHDRGFDHIPRCTGSNRGIMGWVNCRRTDRRIRAADRRCGRPTRGRAGTIQDLGSRSA